MDFLVDALHRHRRRAEFADRRVLLRQRPAQQHRVAPRLRLGAQSRGGGGRSGESGGEVVDEALEGVEERVGAAGSAGDLAVAHEEGELDEAGMQMVRRGREGVEGREVLGKGRRGSRGGIAARGEKVVLGEKGGKERATMSWSSEGEDWDWDWDWDWDCSLALGVEEDCCC